MSVVARKACILDRKVSFQIILISRRIPDDRVDGSILRRRRFVLPPSILIIPRCVWSCVNAKYHADKITVQVRRDSRNRLWSTTHFSVSSFRFSRALNGTVADRDLFAINTHVYAQTCVVEAWQIVSTLIAPEFDANRSLTILNYDSIPLQLLRFVRNRARRGEVNGNVIPNRM